MREMIKKRRFSELHASLRALINFDDLTGPADTSELPILQAEAANVHSGEAELLVRNWRLMAALHEQLVALKLPPRSFINKLKQLKPCLFYDPDFPAVFKGVILRGIQRRLLPWRLFRFARDLYRICGYKSGDLSAKEALAIYRDFHRGVPVMQDDRFLDVKQNTMMSKLVPFMESVGQPIEMRGKCSGWVSLSIISSRVFSFYKYHRQLILKLQSLSVAELRRMAVPVHYFLCTGSVLHMHMNVLRDFRFAFNLFAYIKTLLVVHAPAVLEENSGQVKQYSLASIFDWIKPEFSSANLNQAFRIFYRNVDFYKLSRWFKAPRVLQADTFYQISIRLYDTDGKSLSAHAVELRVLSGGRLSFFDSNAHRGARVVAKTDEIVDWIQRRKASKLAAACSVRVVGYQFSDREVTRAGWNLSAAAHRSAVLIFPESYQSDSKMVAELSQVVNEHESLMAHAGFNRAWQKIHSTVPQHVMVSPKLAP